MRSILVVITDTHAGHKLGLMSPDVMLNQLGKDGSITSYTPNMTSIQDYLWNDIYIPAAKQISLLAKGDPIVVIHGGDPTHGVKHPEQLISTSAADHLLIAAENMTPLLSLPNTRSLRFVMGTDAHEFGEGASSVLLASALKYKYKGIDIGVVEHGYAHVDGISIDFAHHGPGAGSRSWLQGNVARYYLRDIMLTHLAELGQMPPDLVIRGDRHVYANEILMQMHMGREHWSRLVVVPSMCGLGSYGRKVTQSAYLIRNGIVAFVIENKRIINVLPFIKTLDLRTREVI